MSQQSLIKINDVGLKHYNEVLELQLTTLKSRIEGSVPDTIIVCSHPSVVTLGRSSQASDVTTWDGDVVEISRGGRATYHGPGQLVVYPIVNLDDESRKGLKKRDLHGYLRILEEALVSSLAEFGLDAEVRQSEIFDDQGKKLSLTGVWVGEKKIASIGIAVKKWVTYHGIAINVLKDEKAFTGINPCGFSTETMCSLQEIKPEISYEALQENFVNKLKSLLV